MNKEIIRDFYNRIIGYIETDNQGNKTVRDFYNRIIAKGDASVGLIYAEEAKKKK